MKNFYIVLLLVSLCSYAQPPAGYYDDANGLSGYALKNALETIIDADDDSNGQPFHDITVTYSDLWTLYETSDVRGDGKVWEMYSDCDFTFVVDQDTGTGGSTECDKFNREHSFPRSWFGDDSGHPIFNDPFHVIPSDKKVNAERGNLAFGEVASATYTSLNGSQIGSSSIAGPTGNVFEPADEFKGDLARGIFYIAVRYQDDIASWEANDTDGDSMLDGSSNKVFEQWALEMLYNWHINDPVSAKETQRNEAIFAHQDNRNPFIDNPQYIEDIWQEALSISEFNAPIQISLYPNPVSGNTLFVNTTTNLEVEFYDVLGKQIYATTVGPNTNDINVSSFTSGVYILKLRSDQGTITKKFIKQ